MAHRPAVLQGQNTHETDILCSEKSEYWRETSDKQEGISLLDQENAESDSLSI